MTRKDIIVFHILHPKMFRYSIPGYYYGFVAKTLRFIGYNGYAEKYSKKYISSFSGAIEYVRTLFTKYDGYVSLESSKLAIKYVGYLLDLILVFVITNLLFILYRNPSSFTTFDVIDIIVMIIVFVVMLLFWNFFFQKIKSDAREIERKGIELGIIIKK